MASAQDFEVEGATSFASQPLASYRYVIKVEDCKMSIWMEDRNSKSNGTRAVWIRKTMSPQPTLSPDDSQDNRAFIIVAKCFQHSLDCKLDDSSVAQRKLTAVEGGILRLELAVKIRVFSSTWEAKYVFDLEPVSVERVDILESKLRDQQEALDNLLSAQHAEPLFVQLEATQKAGLILRWRDVASDDFFCNNADGALQFRRRGVFSIVGVVNCCPKSNGESVRLVKNDESFQVNYAVYAQNQYTSVPLNSVVRLKKGDKLTATCSCDLGGTSRLTVVRLGS